MNPRWEESEFILCDLQAAARFIRRDNPAAARAFLEAAYDSFEFLARNPGIGRTRADLGFPEVRPPAVSYRQLAIGYRQFRPGRAEPNEPLDPQRLGNPAPGPASGMRR